MRRLLVAAAVSLASASEPFSWADAQAAMHACTNGSRPLVDKYAYSARRLVEPRRVADRAAATHTETPARARAAETPRGSAAEASRPRTREGAGAGGSGGAAAPQ